MPAWRARSATRWPRRPSTWRIWDLIGQTPRCLRSASSSAGTPTGCASRTWSASHRPRRWSPRPSGCATTPRDHDVQGQGRTPARTASTSRPVAPCERRSGAEVELYIDGNRAGPPASRLALSGRCRTSTSRSPRSSAPPTTCSAGAGSSSSRRSRCSPTRASPGPAEVTRELLGGAATGISIKTSTDRIHDQPAGARPVRGTGRRGRHRQPDRRPGGVAVRRRLRRRPPLTAAGRPSSRTTST